MSRPSIVLGITTAALLVAVSGPPVSAHTYDKLTFLTFSDSVQIPGLTLGAGTYRFRLANPSTGRNVVQVLSNDGYYVYAMFHTIPDVRATATEEATVTFREVPVGVAPPIKSLFYGGETHGYEFLYPRGGWNMIPSLHPQPPITYEPIVAAVTPAIEEALIEPVMSEPIAVEPAFAQGEPAPVLPATASPLPIVAMGGSLSVLAGLVIGLLRRRLG